MGSSYKDFHQLTDEETIGLLRQRWAEFDQTATSPMKRQVSVPPLGLVGSLCVPADPRGIILFARGSGSSRLSPRNAAVADRLNAQGFATLLLDLLTVNEASDRRNASTGAGAAMLAAAELRARVAAVVSRGGRPDLAGPRLAEVEAPTLFIVGGDDRQVLELNRKALAALRA